ncbi:42343_t:CDS:1, partial [Gigaspora margarita]
IDNNRNKSSEEENFLSEDAVVDLNEIRFGMSGSCNINMQLDDMDEAKFVNRRNN